MKKIYKIRLLNAVIYTVAYLTGIYVAFFIPDSNSFADGRFRGAVIGAGGIVIILCIGLAAKRYKETRDIQESFKIIGAFFIAALSIRWFKKTKKRKK